MSDMKDWVSEPSTHGDFYDAPESHQDDDRYMPDALEEDRGSVRWFMLPVAFFFMPGRFMRSFGVHVGTGAVFLALWVTGIASMLNSLENNTMFGSSSPLVVGTWASLWGVAIPAGILRGCGVYWIGGLWYRLRLKMCGLKYATWKTTGRVYILSGFAKQLVYIISIIIATFTFADFDAYIQDEDSSLWMTFGILGIIMVFEILSSITLYGGSVATFQIKKGWALLWLLILPIVLRVFVLIGLGVIALVGTFTPLPQLQTPSTYSGDLIQMEYPSNWITYEDETNPGTQFWVQSVPLIGDAIIEIEVVYKGESLEMFSYAEDGWLERVEYELGEIRSEGDTQYEGTFCTYRERVVTLSGTNYVMKLLHWELSDRSGVLVSMIAPNSSWETAEKGFSHIVRTLKVEDPITHAPDLEHTYTAKLEGIQFEMPGNWWVDREIYDDTTQEDGTVIKGTRFIEAEAPGNAAFRTYLYESGLGPRAELANAIEGYTLDGRLEDEQSFGEWNGMSGFGAHGYATLGGLYYHITVFVTEIEDGRILDVRMLNAIDQESIHAPGLQLIEKSFELQSPTPEPEPASP